jgi:hypothetical protein
MEVQPKRNAGERTAQPLTGWIGMEKGLRYRWVCLSKDEISVLREQVQRRRENIQPLPCKRGMSVR